MFGYAIISGLVWFGWLVWLVWFGLLYLFGFGLVWFGCFFLVWVNLGIVLGSDWRGYKPYISIPTGLDWLGYNYTITYIIIMLRSVWARCRLVWFSMVWFGLVVLFCLVDLLGLSRLGQVEVGLVCFDLVYNIMAKIFR